MRSCGDGGTDETVLQEASPARQPLTTFPSRLRNAERQPARALFRVCLNCRSQPGRGDERVDREGDNPRSPVNDNDPNL
jgi:hypothetical protein